MRRVVAAVGLLLALASPVSSQDSHLLVIVGLAGEPDTGDLFHRWAASLVDAARERYGLPDESVVYLGEDPTRDPARIDGRATREQIDAAVGRLAARARPGDRVFVVLIGHGAAAAGEAQFNLPGRDLTTKDYARLLDRFRAQLVTFVNTASASGGFVSALSARDRTVIAATRTEGERNQTRFGEFFVEALTSSAGDLDKDGRVSVLEAFVWSERRVAESYTRDGQLQTEHPVLDDNANGRGSEALGQPGGDGALARTVFMGMAAQGGAAAAPGADPALKVLDEERRALEDRIAALKGAKDRIEASQYERDLEQLLIALARKTREIREKEKK